MSRTCELAGCGRGGATKCGTAYLCPGCAPRIEALTAEYLAETPPPPFAEGTVVVWAGQSGAWILVGTGQREPEHAELVPVAALRPAVEAKGGVR